MHPEVSVRRFLHPVNIGLVEGMRCRARDQSLWEVMDWAAGECGLSVDTTRGAFLPTGPQLVVGNDPGPMAGFVYLSSVRREDHFFIGTPGWTHMGGIVAERNLPVFTGGSFRRRPLEALRAQLLFRWRDGVPPKAAPHRTRRSLQRAAELVSQGHSSLILPPSGTMGRTDRWKHGVGFLVNLIDNPDAQIVMAHARGIRVRDVARMLNPYWFRIGRRHARVTLEISEPIAVSEFQASRRSSVETSLLIKQRYLDTFGAL